MDAFMNITVNVRSTSAERQIRAVAREVEFVRRAMDRAAISGARFGALSSSNLERYAKNLQWVGRQIEFNFTLPLVLAGGVISKWALDNERAMVRVRKVYNESATTAGGLSEELDLLAESFRLLSDGFGVHQDEVIEIGAAWAQAGANGRALAEATKQTLEVMILGEMEAAEATEALIAIQAQYALSTKELALVMGQLNAIENETAVSFQGLVEAMSRGAGAARAAGVDWREFAAMTAALVPAAGGAAEAGNSLRTMISRIMAPTGQARDLMEELGLAVNEVEWNSSNFMGRLQMLRGAMDEVTTSQRNQIAATVASRWQVNRFNILINDLTDSNGRYQKALDVTADDQKVMNRYFDELRTYLTSTPQGFSILTTQIRNLLTEGIQPLLPFFLQVLTVIRDIVRWFVELPGPVKRTIAVLTGLLIVLGPLLRIWGAFGLVLTRTWGLIKFIGGSFFWLMGVVGLLGAKVWGAAMAIGAAIKWVVNALRFAIAWASRGVLAFVSPWILVLGAVVTAVVLFRDEIYSALQWIVNNWRQLPQLIGTALVAVVKVIRDAALAAYQWLSYFNPFVRHSPSLVESVKAGMAVISSEYSKLGSLGAIFQRAIDVLANFKSATAAAGNALRAAELQESLESILRYSPGAEGPFRAVVASIAELQGQLRQIQNEYNAQAVVVNRWKTELDKANAALDTQKNILGDLQDHANRLQGELTAAKDNLANFSKTPIAGMKEMSDAIFQNEMAQKRLRLEILKLDEAGEAAEDTRNRMAALSGEIEMLRGRREDLRLAGAGSDILGVFDSQIKNLEGERRALMEATGGAGGGDKVDKLRAQLEELQRRGEILDLEEALKFDPLTRQIDAVTNGMKEMPFDELMAKIRQEQQTVEDLTSKWKEAEDAVKAQEDVVAVFTARRDELQQTYDLELDRLNQLETAYNAIESQIRDMETALNDMASAAEKAARAAAAGASGSGGSVSRAVEDFRNSVGDFEIPGGSGADLTGGDIEAFNEEMRAMVEELFPSIDIKTIISEWWGRGLAWMRARWEEFLGWFGGTGISMSGITSPIKDAWSDFIDWISNGPLGSFARNFADTIGNVIDILMVMGRYLSGPVIGIVEMVTGFISDLFGGVFEELKNWWNELAPLALDAFSNVLAVVEGVVKVIGGIIAAAVWVIHAAWAPLSRILQPIFDGIAAIVRSVMQIIRGIIHTILALIGGEWGEVWNGILTIVDGVWDTIFEVIRTVLGIVWGLIVSVLGFIKNIFVEIWGFIVDAVRDYIDGVVGVFTWLDDRTHNIFSGIMRFIFSIFKWVYDKVFGPFRAIIRDLVVNVFTWARDNILRAWRGVRDGIVTVWNWIKSNILVPIARFVLDRVIIPFLRMKNDVVATWQGLKDRAHFIWNAIKTWLSNKVADIRDNIVNKFTNVKERLSDIWNSIKITVESKIGGVADTVRNMVNGVIGGINALIRAWNSMSFRLPSFEGLTIAGKEVIPGWTGPTLSTPNIDYIPRLETGGVFDSPTLALIAETSRARPEIVTPEALMRQVFRGELENLKGTGSREVHFHGDLSFPNITDGSDAEDFIRNIESLAGSR